MALSQPFKIRCRQDQISSTEVGLLTPGTDTTCQRGKENQTINHLLACEKPGTTSFTEVGLFTPPALTPPASVEKKIKPSTIC